MMLPLMGRLPVNSQILAIQFLLKYQLFGILAGFRRSASSIDSRRQKNGSPVWGNILTRKFH